MKLRSREECEPRVTEFKKPSFHYELEERHIVDPKSGKKIPVNEYFMNHESEVKKSGYST